MTEGRYTSAPVFELDFYAKVEGCPYPGIWITEPVYGDDGEYIGRDRIAVYPITASYLDPFTFMSKLAEGIEEEEEEEEEEEGVDRDPDGSRALGFGGAYYDEGMACDPVSEAERRRDCFRAAELLYLHAAHRGNPYGYLCLGYVYAYDRCKGWYIRNWWSLDGTDTDLMNPFPTDKAACRCFSEAAAAGIAEGCYKHGDMLKAGRGCKCDPTAAYSEFLRAFDLGKQGGPEHVWSSAALRIAVCHEEGSGCAQDFAQALEWYERAETGLEVAVRDGGAWYREHLQEAKSGAIRMRQEISGEY